MSNIFNTYFPPLTRITVNGQRLTLLRYCRFAIFLYTLSMKNSHSHYFVPGASRLYFYYLIFIHLFALTSIGITFSGVLFFAGGGVILFSAYYYFVYYHADIMALHYVKNKTWNLYLKNHAIVSAELLGCSVIFRHVLILHFQCEITQQKKSVVWFSDSFTLENFRALRRCVKMGYL